MGRKPRTVSPQVAAHVLHWLGDYQGAEPDVFTARLILTINAAGAEDRKLLRQVYPEYVAAVEHAHKPWALDWLRRIVVEGMAA